MGVQACPFPTAVLSNQTGYETYFCEDFTEHMAPYMEEWKKRGFVPDGIYTGFLSDEKQADKILKFIDTFAGEDTLILTDPVMGDDGAVYPIYTEELCSRFRELARRSYVITPNPGSLFRRLPVPHRKEISASGRTDGEAFLSGKPDVRHG